MTKGIDFKYEKEIEKEKLVELFNSVEWKTAEYPNRLHTAIKNSGYVMSAWNNEDLVGLISAIDDGAINVFITYLLVKPEYQKQGLEKIMMNDFCKKYEGFGRRILSTEFDKEKYYTVNDEQNDKLANKYRKLAQKEKNVLFGGRLAEYKYYDMDDTIKSAFDAFNSEEGTS